MKSWVKIVSGVITKYSDGPVRMPDNQGWVEVPPLAIHWHMVAGLLTHKDDAQIESEIAPDIIEAEAIRAHKIHTMSMAEIESWVDSNVNDLADVKRVLVLLIKLVRAQQRRTHRKK